MTVAVPTNVIEPAAAAVELFVPAGNESVCFGVSVAAGAGGDLAPSWAPGVACEIMTKNSAAATRLNADMTYGVSADGRFAAVRRQAMLPHIKPIPADMNGHWRVTQFGVHCNHQTGQSS